LWTARHILSSSSSSSSSHSTNVESLLGLSAVGAKYRFTYAYELTKAVPYLSTWFFSPSQAGTDAKARTVVLSSDGAPFRTFAPGEEVIISLRQVLAVVKDLPPHYARSDANNVPWEVFRDGIEMRMLVQCFNNDAEVNEASLKMGASNAVPVCYLSITYVRCCPDFQRWEARPDNRVVVDRAVLIRTESGRSVYLMPDTASVVVSLTSALVLLALPMKIMRLFTLFLLGRLSKVYHRVLVQTFDIAEQTTTMAVLLMKNSVPFLELSDVNSTSTGHPGISRVRFMERLKQALQQRRNVMDDAETSAFLDYCLNNIRRGRRTPLQHFRDSFCHRKNAKDANSNEQEAMCDIDTFNVHCSYDSAVDLDTAVALFDVDRKRGFMERLFTPASVSQSLAEVRRTRTDTQNVQWDDEAQTAAASASSANGCNDDFVTLHRATTLEDKRKSVEAQQRRHERDLKTLNSKIEHLEGKLCEQPDASSSDIHLSEAAARFEERLKQLERAISVSEIQVQPMWTAVHEALSSMGERINGVNERITDIASSRPAEPSSIQQQQQQHTGPVLDLESRLSALEAQMKLHIQQQHQQQQQQPQTAGVEPAETQLRTWEPRLTAFIDIQIAQRMRKMEEDVHELIKAHRSVTPARLANQSTGFDGLSPRLGSSWSQRLDTPRLFGLDGEDRMSQVVEQCHSSFRSATYWSSLSSPVLSSRQEGLQPDNHDCNRQSERHDGPKDSARYRACREFCII